jgi:Gylcosyl hydrolase family 115 C-terminal domain
MWAQREFGPTSAPEIAALIAQYTKFNGRRKPELLEPDTFSLVDYQEAEKVLDEWQAITRRAEQIYSGLPENERDAFFQLVLYPVKASAQVAELYIAVGKSHLYARQGRASTNDLAAKARALFQADADLSGEYNHTLAHGKWNHMMDQARIGYTGWHDPPANVMPEAKETAVPVPAGFGVAVEGSASAWPGSGTEPEPSLPVLDVFNQQRRYIEILNRGRTLFTFTASASQPWIILSATHGTIGSDQRLWVSVDWRKAPKGSGSGTVTLAGAGAGSVSVNVRTFNPERPSRISLDGFVEADGYVSMEAAHYPQKTNTASAGWEEIPDYGRTLSSMTIFPMTAPSVTPPDAPCLQYQMYLFNPGTVQVETILAPTLSFVPGRGLRYAIAFDGQPPKVVDALAPQLAD